MRRDEIAINSYPLTDNVTDADFEAALAEAKAEKNLSRANVVRKVKGDGRTDRWADLRKLASEGHTSEQIAAVPSDPRAPSMRSEARRAWSRLSDDEELALA